MWKIWDLGTEAFIFGEFQNRQDAEEAVRELNCIRGWRRYIVYSMGSLTPRKCA